MPTLSYATHRMVMKWLRGIQTTAPTALSVGALTGVPNPDGSNVYELAGGGYQRRSITLSEEITSGGVTTSQNTTAIVFPTASANWPTVTHLGIFSNTGDLLFYGALAAPRAIQQGDALSFGVGTIQLRLK